MSFEETSDELTENVGSLGFRLDDLVAQKKISLDYVQIDRSEIEETGEYDLEGLFIRLEHAIASVGAKRVVLDTIETFFSGIPNPAVVRAEIKRLFQWLKNKGMTTIITGEQGEKTFTRHGLEEYVSDCVIFLDHRISEQVSTGRMRVVKYRGSGHDTNEFPFLIDEKGIHVGSLNLLDVYVGPSGVLTGSARLSRETQEKAKDLVRQQDAQIKELDLDRKRKAMEGRIADIRDEFKTEEAEVKKSIKQEKLRQRKVSQDREVMAKIRKAD